MKLPSRRPALSLGLVGALVAIIVVLGFLQVHWSAEVSQAVRERMRANLSTEVLRFRADFRLQLARICWALQPPGQLGPKTLKFYADRYDDWMSASARPELVGGLFIWDRQGERLWQLDPIEERFKLAAWPASFADARVRLERYGSAALSETPPATAVQGWTLFEDMSILFHPLFDASGSPSPDAPRARLEGGVIVALNMQFIWHKLVPELVARYFRGPAGSEYRVAIVRGQNPVKILYQSSSAPADAGQPTGDVVENLVGRSSPRLRTGDLADERVAVGGELPGQEGEPDTLISAPRRAYPPLRSLSTEGAPWQIVVRHRSGSVEAAVASLRRRNLAVSFGVLFLLAISLALIVVSAQRAQRLATLQMDFVAGVSHELRTPLAVICSAAENLADGIVGGAPEVRTYGALIRDEGRRLSDMVGQILVFAAGRAGRRTYQQQPMDIAEVVEAAFANLQSTLDDGHVGMEKDVQPGAAFVVGDFAALVQCVQNLISNAVKYGGADPWVRVSSEKAAVGQGEEVRVTVEDRGPGIDPEDLPHIFEPFYRGKNGASGHAHGTGLGLSLAKEIAEAMGGRLSVETERGRGSRFTLHLPALQMARPPA